MPTQARNVANRIKINHAGLDKMLLHRDISKSGVSAIPINMLNVESVSPKLKDTNR
jgi:hypothetical protein